MIEVKNLNKSFGKRHILKGVTFTVNKGEIFFLLGPSGCGKSTVFKHLMGLYHADSGSIKFNGEEMVGADEKTLDKLRTNLGVLFQSSALLKSLTIEQNIALPLRELTDLNEKEISEKVHDALERVFLKDEILELKPDQVSGGMQKRVGLARAIIRNPDLILYDEPTTGLDPVVAQGIHDMIESLRDQIGVTSIVVSHDLPGALAIADKLAIVMDGVIATVGTPEEVQACPDKRIQEFLAAGQGVLMDKTA